MVAEECSVKACKSLHAVDEVGASIGKHRVWVQ